MSLVFKNALMPSENQQVLRLRQTYLMRRLLILPLLLGVLSPVTANAGDWVYMARGENEMRRKEVGITKKECFKIKREEQKKARKNKYKLSYNKCFSTK